jgi:hypothetical protein
MIISPHVTDTTSLAIAVRGTALFDGRLDDRHTHPLAGPVSSDKATPTITKAAVFLMVDARLQFAERARFFNRDGCDGSRHTPIRFKRSAM